MTTSVNVNVIGSANFAAIEAATARLKASFAQLQAQMSSGGGAGIFKAANAELTAFNESLAASGAYSVHLRKIGTEADRLAGRLERNRITFNDVSMAMRKATASGNLFAEIGKKIAAVSTAQAYRLGETAYVYENLSITTAKLTKGTLAHAAAIAAQNKALRQASIEVVNMGKNLQWTGRQLTMGITMPLAMVGGAAAMMFNEMDKNLTKLAKVYGVGLTQPTEQAISKVKKQVVDLSIELGKTLGVTAAEVTDIAQQFAAAGLQGKELINATKQASRMIVLGEADKQDAITATISLQTAYKLNTEQVTEAVNFFNAAQAATSTNMNDLIQAIPRVGPVIKNLGGSYKDMVAILAALKEGGVPANEAANAIKNSLSRIIAPTEAARKRLLGFGIDLDKIVKTNAGNLSGTLEDLQKGLLGLDKISRQQAITDLFGRYQSARMTAFIENFNQAGSQSAKVVQMMGKSAVDLANIADTQTKKIQQSASGRFKIAVETLKNSLMPIGKMFLDYLTPVVNAISNVVEFMKDLPGPVKGFIKALGAIAAGVGPVVMVFGLMGNLLGSLAMGFVKFKSVLGAIRQLAIGGGWEGFKTVLLGLKDMDPVAARAARAIDLLKQSTISADEASGIFGTEIDKLIIRLEALQSAAAGSAAATTAAAEAAATAAIKPNVGLPMVPIKFKEADSYINNVSYQHWASLGANKGAVKGTYRMMPMPYDQLQGVVGQSSLIYGNEAQRRQIVQTLAARYAKLGPETASYMHHLGIDKEYARRLPISVEQAATLSAGQLAVGKTMEGMLTPVPGETAAAARARVDKIKTFQRDLGAISTDTSLSGAQKVAQTKALIASTGQFTSKQLDAFFAKQIRTAKQTFSESITRLSNGGPVTQAHIDQAGKELAASLTAAEERVVTEVKKLSKGVKGLGAGAGFSATKYQAGIAQLRTSLIFSQGIDDLILSTEGAVQAVAENLRSGARTLKGLQQFMAKHNRTYVETLHAGAKYLVDVTNGFENAVAYKLQEDGKTWKALTDAEFARLNASGKFVASTKRTMANVEKDLTARGRTFATASVAGGKVMVESALGLDKLIAYHFDEEGKLIKTYAGEAATKFVAEQGLIVDAANNLLNSETMLAEETAMQVNQLAKSLRVSTRKLNKAIISTTDPNTGLPMTQAAFLKLTPEEQAKITNPVVARQEKMQARAGGIGAAAMVGSMALGMTGAGGPVAETAMNSLMLGSMSMMIPAVAAQPELALLIALIPVLVKGVQAFIDASSTLNRAMDGAFKTSATEADMLNIKLNKFQSYTAPAATKEAKKTADAISTMAESMSALGEEDPLKVFISSLKGTSIDEQMKLLQSKYLTLRIQGVSDADARNFVKSIMKAAGIEVSQGGAGSVDAWASPLSNKSAVEMLVDKAKNSIDLTNIAGDNLLNQVSRWSPAGASTRNAIQNFLNLGGGGNKSQTQSNNELAALAQIPYTLNPPGGLIGLMGQDTNSYLKIFAENGLSWTGGIGPQADAARKSIESLTSDLNDFMVTAMSSGDLSGLEQQLNELQKAFSKDENAASLFKGAIRELYAQAGLTDAWDQLQKSSASSVQSLELLQLRTNGMANDLEYLTSHPWEIEIRYNKLQDVTTAAQLSANTISDIAASATSQTYTVSSTAVTEASIQSQIDAQQSVVDKLKEELDLRNKVVEAQNKQIDHAMSMASLEQQYNAALAQNDLVKANDLKRQMTKEQKNYNDELKKSALEDKLAKAEKKLAGLDGKMQKTQSTSKKTTENITDYQTQLDGVIYSMATNAKDAEDQLNKLAKTLYNKFGVPIKDTKDNVAAAVKAFKSDPILKFAAESGQAITDDLLVPVSRVAVEQAYVNIMAQNPMMQVQKAYAQALQTQMPGRAVRSRQVGTGNNSYWVYETQAAGYQNQSEHGGPGWQKLEMSGLSNSSVWAGNNPGASSVTPPTKIDSNTYSVGDTYGAWVLKSGKGDNGKTYYWWKNKNTGATIKTKMYAAGGIVTGYDNGGTVRGPGTATSDSIPAMLSNGEYVIKASSVQKYGKETFDALNTQKFADGGMVHGYDNGGIVNNSIWGNNPGGSYQSYWDMPEAKKIKLPKKYKNTFVANELLGVDDFGWAVKNAKKGQWGEAVKSGLAGIAELGTTALSAVSFGSASGILKGGELALKGITSGSKAAKILSAASKSKVAKTGKLGMDAWWKYTILNSMGNIASGKGTEEDLKYMIWGAGDIAGAAHKVGSLWGLGKSKLATIRGNIASGDFDRYLSAAHSSRNPNIRWGDPLSHPDLGKSHQGRAQTYGPGTYQYAENVPYPAGSFPYWGDSKYRNSRNPLAIWKFLTSNGYYDIERMSQFAKGGVGPDFLKFRGMPSAERNALLRAEGYYGIRNSGALQADFLSGTKWYNNMTTKPVFGSRIRNGLSSIAETFGNVRANIKSGDLDKYLTVHHQSTNADIKWTDPLTHPDLGTTLPAMGRKGGRQLLGGYGPGTYQFTTSPRTVWAPNIYRNSRNPLAIWDFLKSKGYYNFSRMNPGMHNADKIDGPDFATFGQMPPDARNLALRDAGYYGVTTPRNDKLVDFVSGTKWYNKMKQYAMWQMDAKNRYNLVTSRQIRMGKIKDSIGDFVTDLIMGSNMTAKIVPYEGLPRFSDLIDPRWGFKSPRNRYADPSAEWPKVRLPWTRPFEATDPALPAIREWTAGLGNLLKFRPGSPYFKPDLLKSITDSMADLPEGMRLWRATTLDPKVNTEIPAALQEKIARLLPGNNLLDLVGERVDWNGLASFSSMDRGYAHYRGLDIFHLLNNADGARRGQDVFFDVLTGMGARGRNITSDLTHPGERVYAPNIMDEVLTHNLPGGIIEAISSDLRSGNPIFHVRPQEFSIKPAADGTSIRWTDANLFGRRGLIPNEGYTGNDLRIPDENRRRMYFAELNLVSSEFAKNIISIPESREISARLLSDRKFEGIPGINDIRERLTISHMDSNNSTLGLAHARGENPSILLKNLGLLNSEPSTRVGHVVHELAHILGEWSGREGFGIGHQWPMASLYTELAKSLHPEYGDELIDLFIKTGTQFSPGAFNWNPKIPRYRKGGYVHKAQGGYLGTGQALQTGFGYADIANKMGVTAPKGYKNNFVADELLGVDDFAWMVKNAQKGQWMESAKSGLAGVVELGSTIAAVAGAIASGGGSLSLLGKSAIKAAIKPAKRTVIKNLVKLGIRKPVRPAIKPSEFSFMGKLSPAISYSVGKTSKISPIIKNLAKTNLAYLSSEEVENYIWNNDTFGIASSSGSAAARTKFNLLQNTLAMLAMGPRVVGGLNGAMASGTIAGSIESFIGNIIGNGTYGKRGKPDPNQGIAMSAGKVLTGTAIGVPFGYGLSKLSMSILPRVANYLDTSVVKFKNSSGVEEVIKTPGDGRAVFPYESKFAGKSQYDITERAFRNAEIDQIRRYIESGQNIIESGGGKNALVFGRLPNVGIGERLTRDQWKALVVGVESELESAGGQSTYRNPTVALNLRSQMNVKEVRASIYQLYKDLLSGDEASMATARAALGLKPELKSLTPPQAREIAVKLARKFWEIKGGGTSWQGMSGEGWSVSSFRAGVLGEQGIGTLQHELGHQASNRSYNGNGSLFPESIVPADLVSFLNHRNTSSGTSLVESLKMLQIGELTPGFTGGRTPGESAWRTQFDDFRSAREEVQAETSRVLAGIRALKAYGMGDHEIAAAIKGNHSMFGDPIGFRLYNHTYRSRTYGTSPIFRIMYALSVADKLGKRSPQSFTNTHIADIHPDVHNLSPDITDALYKNMLKTHAIGIAKTAAGMSGLWLPTVLANPLVGSRLMGEKSGDLISGNKYLKQFNKTTMDKVYEMYMQSQYGPDWKYLQLFYHGDKMSKGGYVIPKFHQGWNGDTKYGDELLAVLQRGEVVVPKDTVKNIANNANSSYNTNSVIVNVTQPNATAQEIANAVSYGMQQREGSMRSMTVVR